MAITAVAMAATAPLGQGVRLTVRGDGVLSEQECRFRRPKAFRAFLDPMSESRRAQQRRETGDGQV
jgi:hypothetical protein